ncbi:acyltransferase family protein [Parafrankia discariae]|uniref:acyltransferase family protein n=1 Tax=Parafrankia discariae TaxID=365528 RepID=UPI00036E16C7|nr:acyltransferase [Parafrankia discariae]
MTAGFDRGSGDRAPGRPDHAAEASPGAAVAAVPSGSAVPSASGAPAGVSTAVAGPPGPVGAPVVFAGFDGLRAIAALLVLVVHVAFNSGLTTGNPIGVYTARGEIGVAVFFLISGFLLYRPFAVAHLSGRSAPDAAGFYIRRLVRIIPLYWLALAVALNVVSNDKMGVHGFPGLLQTAFFMQGYRNHWAIQGLTQAWTLNVEFAFYISVPLYAWLLVRRRRTPGAQFRVELAALAVIFVISRVLHYALIGSRIWWADGWTVWLPVWWDLFAMGMLLAVLSAWYVQNGRSPAWARWRWSGEACWLVAAFFYWVASTRITLPLTPLFVPDRTQDMGRHLFYGLFGFFLILPAVFGPADQGLVRRLLTCRPMAYLGLISYGIYLWHTVVIEVVAEHTGTAAGELAFVPFFLLVLALTCAVSTITYFLVERPCMALGREWARRVRARSRPVPAGAGGPGPAGARAPAGVDERWSVESQVDERWRQELSGAGHPGADGALGGAPDGESARTMPLRTGRGVGDRSGAGPGARSGDPAADRSPGPAPRPRARPGRGVPERGVPGRGVSGPGGPGPDGTAESRLGHIPDRGRDDGW